MLIIKIVLYLCIYLGMVLVYVCIILCVGRVEETYSFCIPAPGTRQQNPDGYLENVS